MALINGTIPSFLNGISQQPATLRSPSQAELQENCIASVVEGLGKRPSTWFLKTLETNKDLTGSFVYTIDRDINEKYIVVMTTNDIKVFDIEGNEKSVSKNSTSLSYMTTSNPRHALKAVTIADYTFVLNTEKTVEMSSSTSGSFTPCGLLWVSQAYPDTKYSVTVEGTEVASYTSEKSTTETSPSVHAIINSLYSQMSSNLDTANTWYVTIDHHDQTMIYIRRRDNGNFNIEATDSEGGRIMQLVNTSVNDFADLPPKAVVGMKVEVRGTPTNPYDTYYVEFKANSQSDDSAFARGFWEECLGPNQKYAFNGATLPQILVRESDGTFSFKPADWGNRKVGDEDTVPTPSFVGRKINDVFFYRNRLGFLSDTNAIFSRPAEYFEFFSDTATTITSADPVDISNNHTSVCILYNHVDNQKDLLFFSDKDQFYLEVGDIFDPETADIKHLTSFENDRYCKPISLGKNVFFSSDKGAYAGVHEFYVDMDSEVRDALDITDHVSKYIPSPIIKLTGSTNEQILVAQTKAEPDSLFIYQYYWKGQEKLQSAWSRWTLHEGEIIYVEFIGNYLVIMVQYGTEVYLLRSKVTKVHTDTALDFEFYMDKKVTDEDCSVVYDEVANTTTYTLPYNHLDADRALVVTRDGSALIGMTPKIVSIDGNTVVVDGDYRDAPVYIGETFPSGYRLSTQYPQSQDEHGNEYAITAGRLQLRRLQLSFYETAFFKVEIDAESRDPFYYDFTSKFLGELETVIGQVVLSTGDLSLPILSKNDQVKITFLNDTHLPFHLVSAEWEGFYTSRTRR